MSKLLHLTLILSLLFLSRAAIDLSKWELFAETTRDISVRGQRMGRVHAAVENTNDAPLYFLNQTTQTWETKSTIDNGDKIRIGVHEEYRISKNGVVASRPKSPGNWHAAPSLTAYQLAIDDNDDTYLWFCGASPTISEVRKYDREARQFISMSLQSVVSLAVDPQSRKPWAVQSNGNIYRYYAGGFWTLQPGKANYIAFGKTNVPYIVSQEGSDAEGSIIKKWNDATQGWETIPGITGNSLALDDHNNLYVVTKANKVYRQRGVVSTFCPMCRANAPEWSGYQGNCSQNLGQCINCLSGTYAVESPLRCEPCPPECPECSSSTTCTACPANSFLAPNGTCLTSCDAPLVPIANATGKYCKGPCADEPLNTFYYPSNDTCQDTCDLPTSGEFYTTCDPCPEDCLVCSNTATCSQCISTSFLTPIGTCRPSCPHPLESFQDTAGVWHCKGPCAAEPTDIYYHAVDDSCRPICSVPILTCSAINL